MEAEKRSRVRERRREGRYRTYDWSEFCLNNPRHEPGTSAQTLQNSPSPAEFSPPTSSPSTTSSLCSVSAQPIRDHEEEGVGSERAGRQPSTNSGIEETVLPPPPSFSLTPPEKSEQKTDQGCHGDGSDRQRDDEERGPLNFDLMDDRKDCMADEKQANETVQVWSLQTHTHAHKHDSAHTHKSANTPFKVPVGQK